MFAEEAKTHEVPLPPPDPRFECRMFPGAKKKNLFRDDIGFPDFDLCTGGRNIADDTIGGTVEMHNLVAGKGALPGGAASSSAVRIALFEHRRHFPR